VLAWWPVVVTYFFKTKSKSMGIEEIIVGVIVVHLVFGLFGIEVKKHLDQDLTPPTQEQTDMGRWLDELDKL
jgi:hypothetical protein